MNIFCKHTVGFNVDLGNGLLVERNGELSQSHSDKLKLSCRVLSCSFSILFEKCH